MSGSDVQSFIDRWKSSGGNEMANFQSFAEELVQLLGLEPIKVVDAEGQNNEYRFERPVTFTHTGREGMPREPPMTPPWRDRSGPIVPGAGSKLVRMTEPAP